MNFSSINDMKNKGFLILMFFFFCSSCTPKVHYQASYAPTDKVDLYYDADDVDKRHTTICKLTHGNFFDYEMETIKQRMIQKAKSVGADGIIFTEIQNVIAHSDNFHDEDRLSITARVIRYK